jgi:hypothetical protein
MKIRQRKPSSSGSSTRVANLLTMTRRRSPDFPETERRLAIGHPPQWVARRTSLRRLEPTSLRWRLEFAAVVVSEEVARLAEGVSFRDIGQ